MGNIWGNLSRRMRESAGSRFIAAHLVILAVLVIFMGQGTAQASSIKLVHNFQPGSAAAFENALTPDIKTVILDVSGGYLSEGMEIGRIIRARGLKTFVPEDASCLSACAEAFIGGVRQRIDGVVAFHVPRVETARSRGQAFSLGLAGGTLTAKYRHEMGYGFGLTDAIMRWTNDSRLLAFRNTRELDAYREGQKVAQLPNLMEYRP